MIGLIDGTKAGGARKILLKHVVFAISSLLFLLGATAMLRFFLGKSVLIPWGAEYNTVLDMCILVQIISFLRELVRNGEKSKQYSSK